MKEVHGYIKTAIVVGAIVFAWGGYAMKISGNSDAIATNEISRTEADKAITAKVDGAIEDIHRIELNAKDTHALASQAAEALLSIDVKFSTIQTQLNEQATIQAVNSEKLKTLTKD